MHSQNDDEENAEEIEHLPEAQTMARKPTDKIVDKKGTIKGIFRSNG